MVFTIKQDGDIMYMCADNHMHRNVQAKRTTHAVTFNCSHGADTQDTTAIQQEHLYSLRLTEPLSKEAQRC